MSKEQAEAGRACDRLIDMNFQNSYELRCILQPQALGWIIRQNSKSKENWICGTVPAIVA